MTVPSLVEPKVIIFIDETNQDLDDLAQALDVPVSIFRIKKFIVNGQAEYFSPDSTAPIIESEPSDEGPKAEYDVIGLLGGGKLQASIRRFRCYRLDDGSIVQIRESKYYPGREYYWYGISTSSLSHIEQYGVTHVIFVMGDFGFVKVPMEVIREFLRNANTSQNPDGTVRHYHCLITHSPEPELFSAADQPRFSLAEYFHPFA